MQELKNSIHNTYCPNIARHSNTPISSGSPERTAPSHVVRFFIDLSTSIWYSIRNGLNGERVILENKLSHLN